MSKAFFRSRKITALTLPLSMLKAQLSVTSSKEVTVEWSEVNETLTDYRKLDYFQLNISKIDPILSKTLATTGIIEIAW